MIYLLVFTYIIILIYNYDIRGKRQGKTIHYGFLFLLFVLIAGLSYRIGIDPIRYEDHFNKDFINGISFQDLFNGYDSSAGSEPLWFLLNWIFYELFGEFTALRIVLALFVNGVIFFFVKKYSPAVFTSIFLYAIILYVQLNFEVLRESVAVCFFIIAYDKLISKDKGLIKYYLWLIPAFFFHRFAFIAVLFPMFSIIKLNKTYMIVLIAVMVIMPYVMSLIESAFNIQLFNLALSNRVEGLVSDGTYGNTSLNIFGYIELFLLSLLPLLLVVGHSNHDKFTSMALVYIVILLLKSGAFVILYRINNYLCIPMVVALSCGVNNAIYKKDFSHCHVALLKNSFVPIVALLIFILYFSITFASSEKSCLYYPYSSVISKETNPMRESLISYLEPFIN